MPTLTLKERMRQLETDRASIESKIMSAMENATMRAVEKATELTPPTQNDLRGTNTRSGEMKQHWATDSRTKPVKSGSTYSTLLADDKDYASYVNDGHRMDRHFVPGLYVNPESGMLEYDPSKKVGIVVGTKTAYVPGLHITDEAIKTWRETLEQELGDIGEVLG